ncbi:MAG: tRNA lysidine(34) synthetase TilS [Phycisphaerae bacterium]
MTEPDPSPLDLESRLAAAIDDDALLAPGERVVVAVSGGLDSVALLELLGRLSARRGRGYRLTVAHLDHALRDESVDDADFVERLAGQAGLACIRRRVDVAGMAEEWGMGIEEAARRCRYDFLCEAARAARASAVATAHHADDQVETALFRLLRGSHLAGLAGMPASRQIAPGVRLVRPLLNVRRRELEACCRATGHTWREDATNRDTDLTRNFLRRTLLPLLRERMNPRVDEAILRTAAAAGEASQLLVDLARRWRAEAVSQRPGGGFVVGVPAAQAARPMVLRAVLRDLLAELGAGLDDVSADVLERARSVIVAGVDAKVDLPGGIRLERRADEARLYRPVAAEPAERFEVALAVPGCTVLPDGRSVRCEVHVVADGAAESLPAKLREDGPAEVLDADALHGALLARPRAQGDAYRPLGAPGTQSVGDMLGNAKIPPHRRANVLCVCDREGVVLAWPMRIAERVKLTAGTTRAISIRLLPADR